MDITVKQWLDSEPDPSEIREKDGGKYIPYYIIVEKLNKLCEQGTWGSSNFRHLYQHLQKGKYLISGSIDLEIQYEECLFVNTATNEKTTSTVSRTLSGAATFVINGASNPHVAATCKSLAIMNAVKPLGRQFGWGLNGFENEIEMPEDEPKVVEPEDTEINNERAEVKAKIVAAKNSQEAKEILEASNFRYDMNLKSLVHQKQKP